MMNICGKTIYKNTKNGKVIATVAEARKAIDCGNLIQEGEAGTDWYDWYWLILEKEGSDRMKATKATKATKAGVGKVKDPVRVYFIKKLEGKKPSMITVATKVIGDQVKIAFAYCSPRDWRGGNRVNRKMGRNIAMGRLNQLECKEFDHADHVITVPFSGHSANDLVKAWRNCEHKDAPTIWKGVKLSNTKKHGLVAEV